MAEDREDVDVLLAIIFSFDSDSIDYKKAAEQSDFTGPPSLTPQKAL